MSSIYANESENNAIVANANNKPKAISLFSGMGGDSLGIQNAGFDIIAFNEFEKPAIDTHHINFPDSTLICDPSQKKEKERHT
jgi:site-specific DNA-cytosine methylase